MEIFKNKTSGKYFIGIDGEDGETALMNSCAPIPKPI